MYRNQTITVCLPCRNEGNHLKQVIKGIPDIVDEIIVVSNASKDNTVAVAKKIGGRVRVIEDNRTVGGIGYGFAHMSGIKAAKSSLIVGADGDATYPIEDLSKVIDHLLDSKLDFISCSRYPMQDGTKIPFKLQLGVTLLNWEVRILYGIGVKDVLSGMWVFKKTIRNKLQLTMGEWNLSPQIKINAATNHQIKFEEYLIKQHQRMGDTKQNYFKTGFAHAWWIFKNRFTKT
jgi:glycosyltransferase involved in cell wall biosynthesis